MSRLFDPDSYAWKPMGWLGDAVLLSMLWFICSVPLLTLGASTTALYDAAVRGFRYGDKDSLGRFLRTFKGELKTSVPATLLWAAVVGLGYLALRAYGNGVEITELTQAISFAGVVLLAVLLGFPCWSFAILSRFTFRFSGLVATTVKLAVSRVHITLVLGASAALCVWLCVKFILPIFFLPCLTVLFWSLMTERVFQKYM